MEEGALQAVSCSAVKEPSLGVVGRAGGVYSAVSLKLLILYFQRNCEFTLGKKILILTMTVVTEQISKERIISSTNFNAQFSLFINNKFSTLLSSTCFEH